jgi:homoserine O-succinyltransferase
MVVTHLDALGIRGHRSSGATGTEPRWSCALVNNMPDSAFEETERQFLGLLDAGSGTNALDTGLYVMEGIDRGEQVSKRIDERYAPVSELYRDPPDVLIVTGANPVEKDIRDEPFWSDVVTLLSWASESVQSMLLSCLAAHAALTIFDGLERQHLARKCTGVFSQEVELTDSLAIGVGSSLALPHSRLNTVPTSQIRAAGYDVPLYSDEVGWSVATRVVEQARVVLVQAHPEYGPSTLLREYHRDARRFVLGTRDQQPELPSGCVAPDDWDLLAELHERITTGERDPQLLASFPFDEVGGRAPWSWHEEATQLYANWLSGVPKRSA